MHKVTLCGLLLASGCASQAAPPVSVKHDPLVIGQHVCVELVERTCRAFARCGKVDQLNCEAAQLMGGFCNDSIGVVKDPAACFEGLEQLTCEALERHEMPTECRGLIATPTRKASSREDI